MMLKSFHSGFSFIGAIRINLADILSVEKRKLKGTEGGSYASAAMGCDGSDAARTLFVVLAASYQL